MPDPPALPIWVGDNGQAPEAGARLRRRTRGGLGASQARRVGGFRPRNTRRGRGGRRQVRGGRRSLSTSSAVRLAHPGLAAEVSPPSPKTTKLYDRTEDTVTVDEIKRLPNRWTCSATPAGVDDAVNLYHDLASRRPRRPAGTRQLPAAKLPPQLDVEGVELDVTDALEAGRRWPQLQAWRPPTTAAEPRRTSATRGTARLYQTGAGSTHCATSRTAAHPAPTTRPPYTA